MAAAIISKQENNPDVADYDSFLPGYKNIPAINEAMHQ